MVMVLIWIKKTRPPTMVSQATFLGKFRLSLHIIFKGNYIQDVLRKMFKVQNWVLPTLFYQFQIRVS